MPGRRAAADDPTGPAAPFHPTSPTLDSMVVATYRPFRAGCHNHGLPSGWRTLRRRSGRAWCCTASTPRAARRFRRRRPKNRSAASFPGEHARDGTRAGAGRERDHSTHARLALGRGQGGPAAEAVASHGPPPVKMAPPTNPWEVVFVVCHHGGLPAGMVAIITIAAGRGQGKRALAPARDKQKAGEMARWAS